MNEKGSAKKSPWETKGVYAGYLLMAVLFYPVFSPLVYHWYDDADASHGFLIIPVCIWLILSNREKLSDIPRRTHPFSLFLLLTSLVGFLVFVIGDIAFLARFFMVMTFYSYVLTVYGPSLFRSLWFPLLYLLFMLPPPTSLILPLSLPLRLFVSGISADLASFFAVPIYQEGNVLQLPTGILEVAPACSGLRSLVSLLALSAIMAYLFQIRLWKGIICFLAAIPVAILANILRVFLSVLMYHHISAETAQGVLHESWGMIVFAFSATLIFFVNIMMKRGDK